MNERGDLEKRLGSLIAAQPPVGLVQRIKGEIPKDFVSAVENDRLRFRRGLNVILRVAITIVALLLLIWLAFAVLDVREHEQRPHHPPTRGKVLRPLRSRPELPRLLPASEVPNGLEMHVEVIGGSADGAHDGRGVLLRDALESHAHVGGKLVAALPAES